MGLKTNTNCCKPLTFSNLIKACFLNNWKPYSNRSIGVQNQLPISFVKTLLSNKISEVRDSLTTHINC